MHFTEELVARYKRERPGIKAAHFHDPSVITCWSNDYTFETVFERQARTFCGPLDTLVGISTSGNSANVIRAVNAAKEKGTTTIGLLGKDGGKLATLCDIPLVVPSNATERIQEVHITFVHIFCELLESA
jgi:D-sedoheptulose 7-phosphate isomerase